MQRAIRALQDPNAPSPEVAPLLITLVTCCLPARNEGLQKGNNEGEQGWLPGADSVP